MTRRVRHPRPAPPPLDQLAEATHLTLREAIPERSDLCILGTRLLLRLCQEHKVGAYPMACEAAAMNRPLVEFVDREERMPTGLDELPEAWLVMAMSKDNPILKANGFMPRTDSRRGGYDGHLVGICEGVLVDVTAGQFDRADRDLDVPDVILTPVTEPELTGAVTRRLSGGGLVQYRLQPRRRDFTQARDWREALKLLGMAREHLAELRQVGSQDGVG